MEAHEQTAVAQPGLSEERLQQFEREARLYEYIHADAVSALLHAVRRFQQEVAWDNAAKDAAIKTQGQIIEELKQQLADTQDALSEATKGRVGDDGLAPESNEGDGGRDEEAMADHLDALRDRAIDMAFDRRREEGDDQC